MKKIFNDIFYTGKKFGKYIFLFWILHPFIDFFFSRINLGFHLYFRFNLIIFPIKISYHIGKVKLIQNDVNDINDVFE